MAALAGPIDIRMFANVIKQTNDRQVKPSTEGNFNFNIVERIYKLSSQGGDFNQN